MELNLLETCYIAGVGVFDVGKGAAQDCVRSPIPASGVEGTQTDLRAVRERACRRRTKGKGAETATAQGRFPTAAHRCQAARQVSVPIVS